MAFNYNAELKDAALLINFGGVFLQAYEFEGPKKDISGCSGCLNAQSHRSRFSGY